MAVTVAAGADTVLAGAFTVVVAVRSTVTRVPLTVTVRRAGAGAVVVKTPYFVLVCTDV